MKKRITDQIVLSGLFIAIGILLPLVTAHAFGAQGTILLPMHLPVFLTGLLCGPQYGVITGIITPALSSLLTGMPPAFPMLPIMAGELAVYGLVSGLMYKKLRLPLYPSLLIAMICGRAAYGLIYAVLFTANNGTLRASSVAGAFIQGLPGIAIQLVLIPVIVTAANKHYTSKKDSESIRKEDTLNTAKQLIMEDKASCVIIKNDTVIYSAKGPGVAPLIALYENNPDILKEAFVVDKVIGKAAAMITVLGGAKKVYGVVMSVAARSYLNDHGIEAVYGRCVEIISNRTGDGLCPLEKSVLDVEDAGDGYRLLKETIARLMKAV